MKDIYVFKNLPEKLVLEISSNIPVISNYLKTVVFIDDFTSLCEDLQETLLEFEVEEF